MHARWSYHRRFEFLMLCPLSVEHCELPSFVDCTQGLLASFCFRSHSISNRNFNTQKRRFKQSTQTQNVAAKSTASLMHVCKLKTLVVFHSWSPHYPHPAGSDFRSPHPQVVLIRLFFFSLFFFFFTSFHFFFLSSILYLISSLLFFFPLSFSPV